MRQVKFEQLSPKSITDPQVIYTQFGAIPTHNVEHQNYWKKIRTVYRSIKLFRSPETTPINSADDITHNNFTTQSMRIISSSSTAKQAQKQAQKMAQFDFSNAINQAKQQQELFELVQSGGNLVRTQKLLDQDPKRYVYDPTSPYRLVNKKNSVGQTLLYVAAKNGHTSMCELLIKNGADPNIIVTINEVQDTPICVALRWRHVAVVQLLFQSKLNKNTIKLAFQCCDNQQKREYKQYLQ